MHQQLNTARFSYSVATDVTVVYGVNNRNIPINHELSHIHTPPPSLDHFGQHLISHYDTKNTLCYMQITILNWKWILLY